MWVWLFTCFKYLSPCNVYHPCLIEPINHLNSELVVRLT